MAGHDEEEAAEVPNYLSVLSSNRSAKTQTDDEHANTAASIRQTKSLEHVVSLPREVLVIGIVIMAQFTTQVGLGQVLAILHIIGDSFGITDPGILTWLIAGYSLTVGTFILVSGRMGDIFGYKNMLVVGYLWFATWTLVAGVSVYSNHVLFVFARVLSGIGPSICLPNGLALLGALYEPGFRKNMAFAAFGACAPIGSIVGGVFASIFAEFAWWPWSFWSFAIVLVLLAMLGTAMIPDPQTVRIMPKSLKDYIVQLDAVAATVGVTALVLINFAWNQAPIAGWDSPYVIVCLILGVLLVPAFFYLEIYVAANPLIPFSAINSTNAFVLGCIACGWGNFGIWVFYIWQIFEVLRGTSPLLGTAYFSPAIVSGIVAAYLTGFLLERMRAAWLMVIAMSAFLTGNLLIATVPPHQIYWAQFFVTMVIAPFGMDMSFPAATIYLSNSIEKERQGVAASLINTIVNYSISLALGFAGTIEVHVNNGGQTPEDILHGYRSALYFGTGLAGFGLFISIIFVAKQYYWDDLEKKTASPDLQDEEEEDDEKSASKPEIGSRTPDSGETSPLPPKAET